MQTAVGVHLFFFCCKGSSAFFLFCKKTFFALQSNRKLAFLRGILESKSAFFDTRPSNLWNFRDFRKGIKLFLKNAFLRRILRAQEKKGIEIKKESNFHIFFEKVLVFYKYYDII
jgi:hypothetical protein